MITVKQIDIVRQLVKSLTASNREDLFDALKLMQKHGTQVSQKTKSGWATYRLDAYGQRFFARVTPQCQGRLTARRIPTDSVDDPVTGLPTVVENWAKENNVVGAEFVRNSSRQALRTNRFDFRFAPNRSVERTIAEFEVSNPIPYKITKYINGEKQVINV